MEPTYYALNDSAARAAHNANSMRPYRSDDADYRAEVDEAYQLADWAAERNPERAEEAHALADRYAQRLAAWYNEGYRIDSICPSVLISGAANFPVRKKERQNAAREKHMEEYEKLKGILAKIRRIGTGADIIKSSDANAADKLRAKIELLEKKHEMMKGVNAYYRKHGTLDGCELLDAEALAEAKCSMEACSWSNVPFPAFSLSNNRQSINAAKKRLAAIETQKAEGTAEREAVIKGENCRVVENVELMRLQLVFDGKPSDEARAALKHWGFRWSPKNGAWQRQLTNNARFALKQLAKE
jgi:hypothetical protein